MNVRPRSGGQASVDGQDRPGDITCVLRREEAYARGDFVRVLAEFWADGPSSETPPGHWNVIANYVADNPLLVKKIGGVGPVVDDLEWDVKMYFAVNAAVHEAADIVDPDAPLVDRGRIDLRRAHRRVPELDEVHVPTLVVQGERDPFGIPPFAPSRTVVLVHGDHSLRGDVAAVSAAAAAWLSDVLP